VVYPSAAVIVLMVLLWLMPRWIVTSALGVAGVEMATKGEVHWLGVLTGWEGNEVELGSYGRFERITIRWNWWDLLVHQQIELLDLQRPRIWVAGAAKAFSSSEKKTVKKSGGSGFGIEFKTLRVNRGKIWLDNLGYGVQAIPVEIGQQQAWELKAVRFGGSGFLGQEQEQEAKIQNITVNSPYDAISPVFFFHEITLRFTWSGLARNEINFVKIDGPKIYVGPNLFEFTDEVKQKRQDWAKPEKNVPWLIKDFSVVNGKLSISGFGAPNLELPLLFGLSEKDLWLRDFEKMKLKSIVAIYDLGYFYPEYGVRYGQIVGDLQFSLPPTDDKANNLVGRVWLDSLSWKDIETTKDWVAVTFDRKGIYGTFGGEAYRGYINGGFQILFAEGFPWEGWLSSDKVDLAPVASKLTPQYLAISGRLDGKLLVKAQSRDIQSTQFDLKLVDRGRLEIRSIDDMLKKIPDEWSSLKKVMTTALLSSFRNYDYTSGILNLSYAKPDSALLLDLKGRQGDRKFDVKWHQVPEMAEPTAPVAKVAVPEKKG
jgi:hypothetical protein